MANGVGPEAVQSREDLGKALTELRLARGLSVRDVAAEADALVGTVAGWFAGQHAPTRASREMFERVLGACGVNDPVQREQWWEAAGRTGRRGGRRRGPGRSPYRGFDVYTTDDSDFFFGRDQIVARLAALVRRQYDRRYADLADGNGGDAESITRRAVAVVGVSGAGKSSLVRAGLAGQTLPGGVLAGGSVTVMVPGDQPSAALDAAVDALVAESTSGGVAVLVIDQAEELWTQNDADDRAAFAARLAERLRGLPVVVVTVLRADFYAVAAEHPTAAEALSDATVLVPRMSDDQLREVIVRPAERAGAVVDDDLVTLLLDDLAVPGSGGRIDAGVLPLLSHALDATWTASDGRRLTVGDYVATGRIDGAVEQTAEAVYAELSPQEQDAAKELLLLMVNVDEDRVTRRTVRRSETPAAAGPVLEAFADARLLTLSSTHVQVAHEALLTAWPRLTGWIDADREELLLRRRLRALTDPWEANGRPDDLLPGRSRLEMFAPLAGAADAPGTGAEQEFLAAGHARIAQIDEAERRRRRQLRRFAWSAGVFGLVAVIAAALALAAGSNAVDQRNAAERSRNETLSRQLAIAAGQLGDRDPFLSAQLAMIAYRQAPTVEARSTLIDTMAGGVPGRFTGAGGSLLLARAGSTMAASSSSGQVRLFELGTGTDGARGIERQIADFSAADGAQTFLGGVVLTPDARTLLLGGRSTIDVWDVADPAAPVKRGSLPDVAGDVNALAISPDGRYLAAAELGAGLQVWRRGDDGWQSIVVDGPAGDVAGAVAFSPDGRALASSTRNKTLDLWSVDGDRLRPTASIDLGWRDNQLAQGLAYHPDGRRLMAALRSRTIDVFDVADPAAPRVERQLEGHTSYVSALALSDDGTELVSAGADNSIRLYRLDDRDAAVRVIPTPANSSSVLMVGDRVVSGSDDGRVQDWPASTGRTQVGNKTVFQIPLAGPEQRLLAADTEVDGRITQWRVVDGGLVRAGPDLVPPPGVDFSGAVVQSPDAKTVTLGSVSGVVYFADYADPQRPRLVGSVQAHAGLNETVDYSAVSGLAVTGGTDQRELTVIDASDPAAPRKVGVFDPGSGVWWASLSPDGTRAAVATNAGQVQLLDLSDPSRPVAYPDALTFGGSALAVRFDGTGDRLVATADDKTVAVADVSDPENPRRVASMAGPAGQLYSAAFSPDGTQIVAGGGNSEIWVWRLDPDGDGAQHEVALHSFPGTVFDVRFRDGDEILATGEGGLVAAWELDPSDLVETVCAGPGDQISEDEWATYVPGVPYGPPC